MNKNNTKTAFRPNRKALATGASTNPNGAAPPPKDGTVAGPHINNMFALSPKKDKAKPIAEYSTKYPATNSASASGGSKGCLFVSAGAEAKDIMNKGNDGMRNQIFSCAVTISFGFDEPTHNITFMRIKPVDTSYDTICAAERNAPKKAYLEFEAQPEIGIPYAPRVDAAGVCDILILMSAPTIPLLPPNGKTAQPTGLSMKVVIGAAIEVAGLALLGKTVSFKSDFKPSARGCSSPK